MKRKPASLTGILLPFSMEDKTVYLARFHANRDMRDLYSDSKQRAEAAQEAFAAKWNEALVTVRRVDGSEFFID